MNKRFAHIPRRFMDELNGDGGEGGGGNTPPVVPPTGGNTPPTGKWYDEFKDPAVKEWLGSYGESYPNPESVALKALNLEKFVGADKSGRGVIAPKPDAKPEEWQEFYRKVGGVPEKSDGYKLPADLDPAIAESFASDPMVASFREFAHKSGMPPVFFESAMKWYVNEQTGGMEKTMKEFEQASERDMADLKSEWQGVEFDKNTELGRRAARQFMPHENDADLEVNLQRIEGALGTKATLKLWAAIGAAMGEHGFESGEGNGGNGRLTAEGARVRIDALKKDIGFQAKFAAGDSDARSEWDRLHAVAYSKPQ